MKILVPIKRVADPDNANKVRIGAGGQKVETGNLEQNPPVQRGDIIYVPKTTIAKVAQFFDHVNAIVRPFVEVTRGIWFLQNIGIVFADQNGPP